jgi:hypothetical protein
MAKPYVKSNNVKSDIAVANTWQRGTDTSIVLTSGADFDAGGGYIRIGDATSFAIMEYTGKTSNTLTGLTACTIGVVVSVGDETKTWPAATEVKRVIAGEEITDLVNGPASVTDNTVVLFDGTTGKKAKAAAADTTTTHFLAATAGAPAFRALSATDLGACITQAATTLYVAKTGDDGNAGTSGAPKLTIGGALDALPFILAHACTINVAPGEYDEILTTKLSKFMIPASLTIQAVDTADRAWHVRGAATAGANTTIDVEAAHVLVDDEWNGAFISIWQDTGSGQIREITDSDESDNRLTVATWDTNPASGSDYILWGAVRVDGEESSPIDCSGLTNVTFKGIGFKASSLDPATTSYYGAHLSNLSAVTFENCGAIHCRYGFRSANQSFVTLNYCSAMVPDDASIAIGFWCFSAMGSYTGCVAYGMDAGKSYSVGIYASGAGVWSGSSSYPSQMRHLGKGAWAVIGGMVTGTTALVYTDNTTDTDPNTPASTADLVADGMAFIQDQP